MNKLDLGFQNRFKDRLLFNKGMLDYVDPAVKLHEETLRHPLSSSAACLNVMGSLLDDPKGLIRFLGACGVRTEEVYKFPSPVTFGGRDYHDRGHVVFEWIGPQESPIKERGGGRGQRRTSIDAFVLARIEGKTTQVLIEWKFTEGLSRKLALGRFSGIRGVERLRRYSSVLAEMRRDGEFPFDFAEEHDPSDPASTTGLSDLSPDHLYQLLRMTLLAKKTTGMVLGDYLFEDYRILHLTHSENHVINILQPDHLALSPGLARFAGRPVHEVWRELLSTQDRTKFIGHHWDWAIGSISDGELKNYLSDRYVVNGA